MSWFTLSVSPLVASILESEEKSAQDIFTQNSFTQKQLEEFIQEANCGNTMAQYIVGHMYSKGKGIEASSEKGFEFYLLAANKGHMSAQFEVANVYYHGNGVLENKRKAFHFYQLAANQGHMLAQCNVGFYFEQGLQVQRDLTKAFKFYLKSANQGYVDAQCNLGLCYAYGRGVSQDFQKAIEYSQMAAAQGSREAKVNIGWVYEQKQEYDKAMKYYLQAAEEGSAMALRNIGLFYELGHGVAVDYNRALSLYQRAAENGHKGAKKNVELLVAKMCKQTSPSLPPPPIPTSANPTLSPASVASIPQTKSLPSETEDWTVNDVVTWMSSLNLSQSYRELIQENHLTGKALLTMKTKEDWQELGVTKFGDLRVLINTPISGGNVKYTTHTPTVLKRINNRLGQTEGLDEVVYQPVINLLAGDFKPPHSCEKHMLTDLPNVLLAVRNISAIVKECLLVTESRLQHLPSHVPTLSTNEALAIAAYSYNVGVIDADANLYHALNAILRKRDPKKMERLKPFLFYLMSGLSKFPPLRTTVYRGIPFSSMQLVRDNYRLGVSVHWSGFTSATTDIESAKDFAQESGIIFRIKVLTGRSIKHYSSIPSEDEVLLSPNIKMIVASNVQKESDGFYYLDLLEQLHSPTFIY